MVLGFQRQSHINMEPKLVLLPPTLILDHVPVEERKEGRREVKRLPKEEDTEKVTVVAAPPG